MRQSSYHLIARKPRFYEWTKHIKIDYHFVREKVLDEVIETTHIESDTQLADLFIKPLGGSQIKCICKQLITHDICALP